MSCQYERWILDGQLVRCVACLAGQPGENAQSSFVHVRGCHNTCVFSKYPWLELRGILRDLAPDPFA